MTVFSNDWFEATVDPAGGKATISRMEGGSSIPFLLNFTWGIVTATGKSITSASHPISSKVFTSAYIDEIGKGKLVELSTRVSPECIDLLLKLVFYDDTPAFTMELVVTNHGSLPVPILEISPAITSAKAGSGLFVSRDLSRCRILEAGLAGVFDLNVRCVAGDEESDSNGNVLVFDELTSKSILCGVIERPNAMVEILANESGAKGLIDELSGLKSFPDWAIKKSIVPFKQVRQNVSYTSNRVLFDTDGKKTPFEMLESYADRLAACLHVEKWPLDKPTPHGWNSWGNPSKTDRHDAGGKNMDALVHDFTEDVVMENLAIADDRLGKFGLAYFQIDDGYQQAHGDWDFNAEKFPRGAKYLFDAIKERGYNPGLWIRPFDLALESKTLACHPEWGLDWEESFPMKERSRKPLDVSRPDVRRWLAEIFTRHARYHGVTWIKTDFTYLLLGGKGFHDPDMTAIEAMQEGFKIIRDEFWITFEKYKKGDDGELVFVDSNVDSFDYGSHVIRFAFHVRNPWAYDYVITTINDFKVKVPEDITYLDILSDVTIPSGGWHVGAGEEKIFYPYWCDISSGDYHDVAFRIVGDQATLPSSEWAILGGDEIMIRLVRIWDWFETPWSSWMGLGVKVLRKMWDVSIHNLDEMYEDFSRSTPVEFRIKLTLDVYNGGNKLLTYGHVAKCSSIINVPEDKLDYLQTVVYISTAYAISVISCFMVGVATLGSGIGIPAGLALLIYSAVSPSVYEYIANKYAQLAADPWDPSYLDIIPDVVIEYPDFPECPEDFSPAVYDLIKERHMLGVELDAYSDAYFLAYNRLDTIRWYGGPPDIELDHLEKLTFLNNEMQRIFQRLSFINGLLNSLISEYAGEMSIGEMFLKVQVQLEMYQDRIVEDYGDDVYSMMIDLFTMDLGDMGDLRTPLALVFNLHILLARSIETTTVNLLSDFQADPSTNVPSILNINAPEEAIVTLPFSISAIIQADAGVSSVMIFYEDQSSSMIDYGDDHFAATVTYTTPGYHSYTIIVRDNNVNSLARKETVYLGFIYVDDGLPPRVEEIHVPVSVLLDSEGEMYVFIVKDTSFASCTAWLDGGVVINTMSQGVLSIPIPNELGMHEILVEASDTRGGTTILGPVTFEVVDDDVDPPAVFMSVPGWINPIEDCFTITFSAGDHSGIASYSLAILDGANTRVIAEHHGPWDALIDIDVQVCKELYDFTRASWLLLVLEVWDDDRDRPGDQLATTISAVVPVGAVAKIEDGKALVSASDDEAWAKPGWNRKQAMMHKLDATIDLMLAGNYREAYDKLLHDIKPKLTGLKTDEHEAPWGNGVFPAPWVIDVELQEAFRIWVNDALATISSMLCATPCITNDGNGNEDGDGGNGEDGGATNEPSSDGKPMTGAHDARAIVATCMVATLACAGLAGAACIARLVRTAPRDKQRRADRKAYQRVRR